MISSPTSLSCRSLRGRQQARGERLAALGLRSLCVGFGFDGKRRDGWARSWALGSWRWWLGLGC